MAYIIYNSCLNSCITITRKKLLHLNQQQEKRNMELHKVVTSKQSQYIGSKTKKKKSFYCLIQLQESVSLHHK